MIWMLISCAGAPARPDGEPDASGALADVVEVAFSGQDATTFSVSPLPAAEAPWTSSPRPPFGYGPK